MLALYNLGNLLGYFLIMIIFFVVAIFCGGKKGAWIFYSIGALWQLLSLSGNQKIANMYGGDTSTEWATYFLLLVITAIIICRRHKEDSANNSNISNENPECICKHPSEGNSSESAVYSICIFDATTHTLRKEKKNIDVTKFPPSKFADNDTYYAIETFRDGKKVRIYYTKDNWDKQIETEISEEKK